MESHLNLGDPNLVENIVSYLKTVGIFDELRRECLADVETKSSCQNLSRRVEGYAAKFLANETFNPNLSKDEVRNKLKKYIDESDILTTGTDHIVEQVINPKVQQKIPNIMEVVHEYLYKEKEKLNKKQEIIDSQKITEEILKAKAEQQRLDALKVTSPKLSLKERKAAEKASNTTRFKKLLEFSKSCMSATPGLSSPDPSKIVSAPILGDHLAAALNSVTSNLTRKESRNSNNDASYPFPSMPSTSKQADVIENLRLKLPDKKTLGDSILSHADIIEELCTSLPETYNTPSVSGGGVDKTADPLPPNSSVSPEAVLVSVEVNAAENEAMFKKNDLQSLEQKQVQSSGAETVNGGHKVTSLPPMPVKEHADCPKSLENKRDKIEKRVKILEKLLEITSPKLSLIKRKAAEKASILQRKSMHAIPYIHLEPTVKKEELNSSEQYTKVINLPYTRQRLKLESNLIEQNAKAIPSPQSNVPPNLSSNAQQKSSSENVILWNSSDSNISRYLMLLGFSKSRMLSTPEGKSKFMKIFYTLLEKADRSYIRSAEFASLMDDTLKKIQGSQKTVIHFQAIKTELKAYKRRRNTLTPAKKLLRLWRTYEQCPLKLGPPDPSKVVPALILGDHLASAISSVNSNITRKESGNSNKDASYPFPCVSSTSKQADIIENLRLKLPDKKSLGDSILSHADIIEELCTSLPGTYNTPSVSGGVDKTADPLPPNSSVSPEAVLVSVEVNAAENESLFKKNYLQSLEQKQVQSSGAETVNGGHKVTSLPPMPVKEHADCPKSLENKSDKIEKRVKILEKHREAISPKGLDDEKNLRSPQNSATAVALSEVSPPPEPKRESRRKRKLNKKYYSSEFSSIFDSKRMTFFTNKSTQIEVAPAAAKEIEALELSASIKDNAANKDPNRRGMSKNFDGKDPPKRSCGSNSAY